MTGAPRFTDAPQYPTGYDPLLLLLGDVTGDGTADAIYVGNGAVIVWLNRCGNGFAPAVEIRGTPRVDGRTTVRLVDLDGVGVSGLLWSGLGAGGTWAFLDLTGGVKPYLLTSIEPWQLDRFGPLGAPCLPEELRRCVVIGEEVQGRRLFRHRLHVGEKRQRVLGPRHHAGESYLTGMPPPALLIRVSSNGGTARPWTQTGVRLPSTAQASHR